MKFAVLGADAQTLPLAAAAQQLGHGIVELEASDDRSAVEAGYDSGGWLDLLDPNFCDAVIVGSGSAGSAERGEQIQELVKQGRPVLATHPVTPSVLTYFEIDMARGESQAVLQHYNPLAHCPQASEFASWIRDGHPRLGKIEQVVAERTLADRSRENVLWHFARDVQLLDLIAGPLDRIGALGSGNVDAAYAGLSLQLLGKPAVPVRWSVAPVEDAPRLTVSFVGEQGRVVAVFDASDRIVELRLQLGSETAVEPAPDYDPAVAAVERFTAAVGENRATSRDDFAGWPAALRAMELVDSIEISLRRGRMIDVHHQQLTEQLAFKGTMAALGCGALLVLPPLLLLAGWLAGLFGIPIAKYWPHVLLALLAAFLLLQFLPKLLYSHRDADSSDSVDS